MRKYTELQHGKRTQIQIEAKWPWAKYPITKKATGKEIGGGVWTHANFSYRQHKYMKNTKFRTFYKSLSKGNKTFSIFYEIVLACKGAPCTPDLIFCKMF